MYSFNGALHLQTVEKSCLLASRTSCLINPTLFQESSPCITTFTGKQHNRHFKISSVYERTCFVAINDKRLKAWDSNLQWWTMNDISTRHFLALPTEWAANSREITGDAKRELVISQLQHNGKKCPSTRSNCLTKRPDHSNKSNSPTKEKQKGYFPRLKGYQRSRMLQFCSFFHKSPNIPKNVCS